jgi:Fe-S cluster assembly protein SufD
MTATTRTAYTADAARALDGPDWLRARRVAAAERVAAQGMPSTDEEVWRYSRIDELDLDMFPPAPVPSAGHGETTAVATAIFDAVGSLSRAVTLDGYAANGFDVASSGAAFLGAADEASLGLVAGEGPDAFAMLNDAFAPSPLLIRVPPHTVVDAPIIIVHEASADGSASFPRLVVDAAEDAEVTVVEIFISGDGPGLVVPVTEISVGRAARVTYVGLQELGLATWQVGSLLARVDADATFRSVAAGFGGDYARLRTDCRLEGRGAHGDLDAVYFGEGRQMLDFRTFQDHIAPDTTSNLLFKGAVGGSSRSVYTGLIRVGKDARGTNAFQTNRNIKLSEHAWAESVPNLMIENNDVRCSHASTVGPVAEEEQFYLESRGVPSDVAERLIVTGFFDEVLLHVPVEALLPRLRATIAAKFERRELMA